MLHSIWCFNGSHHAWSEHSFPRPYFIPEFADNLDMAFPKASSAAPRFELSLAVVYKCIPALTSVARGVARAAPDGTACICEVAKGRTPVDRDPAFAAIAAATNKSTAGLWGCGKLGAFSVVWFTELAFGFGEDGTMSELLLLNVIVCVFEALRASIGLPFELGLFWPGSRLPDSARFKKARIWTA